MHKGKVVRFLTVFLLAMSFALMVNARQAGEKGKKVFTAEQEYLFNIFKNRRSVRKFKSVPVPGEHVKKILEMAITAPTSGNQQPWKFLVITDTAKIAMLKTECINRSISLMKTRGVKDLKILAKQRDRVTGYYADYLSAPVNIVVLTDSNSKYPAYNKHDGPLAAGYLMLAARALGYGTVYATGSIPYSVIKKVFKIPDNFQFICFTPLGIPHEWPAPRGKKPLKDFMVVNKFIKGKKVE